MNELNSIRCLRWCALLFFILLSAGCGGGQSGVGVDLETIAAINARPTAMTIPTPFSMAENQTEVMTVSASDPEGASLDYSLAGTDASQLSISSSGAITFNTAPDYETKTSYSVVVNVSDGFRTANPQALNINITNVPDEWVQRGIDIDGEVEGDYSGRAVSLGVDGTVVAIGADGNDANGDYSGHTRIYAWQ